MLSFRKRKTRPRKLYPFGQQHTFSGTTEDSDSGLSAWDPQLSHCRGQHTLIRLPVVTSALRTLNTRHCSPPQPGPGSERAGFLRTIPPFSICCGKSTEKCISRPDSNPRELSAGSKSGIIKKKKKRKPVKILNRKFSINT